jgi:peptidoglycan/LPS O-acetylase OafA/YrhL
MSNDSAVAHERQLYNSGVNTTQPLSARKLAALDGVRGLAIIGVFISHGVWQIQRGGIHDILGWLGSQGRAGVDLFFVLSGFLITGILLDTRPAANYFQSFYARRALRIFPLYYAFLLLAFTLFPILVTADWQPIRADRWLYFCYLTNWLGLWKGHWQANVLGHLWSLAVEEQFYFCWPLLVWLLRPAILLPVLVCGEAALIGGRALWVMNSHPGLAVSFATITRMDGLLLGAAIAILVRRYRIPERVVKWIGVAAIVGLEPYMVMSWRYGDSETFTALFAVPIVAFLFTFLVLHAVVTDGEPNVMQRVLTRRPLMRTGKYAYGIYIYHVPILYFGKVLMSKFFPQWINDSAWVGYLGLVLLWFVSFSVAKLSYRYFETFFLGFKERFEARFPQPAAEVQTQSLRS